MCLNAVVINTELNYSRLVLVPLVFSLDLSLASKVLDLWYFLLACLIQELNFNSKSRTKTVGRI